MSNYTKSTNFATKDTLPTGDSGKIVKGTEIDNEFNAIASAISSKADTASPTFTGTPAAPTAVADTNTTQIATTAFVFAERTNSATITNKTISADSNTLSGLAASSFVLSNSSGNIDGSAAQKAIPSGVVVGTTDTQTLTNKTLTSPVISSPAMSGTPTAPTAAAGTNTTQIATTAFVISERTEAATLTNKTLTSPTVSGLSLSDSSIVFEGSSADAYETTLTVTNPTADRTVTIPDATTTLVGTDTTQTLTNKTIALGSNTVSGTKSQFNTAVTDTDIAFVNDFTGSNQSLSSNGYQKLPGGLILQWCVGSVMSAETTQTINFPISFPTAALSVQVTTFSPAGGDRVVQVDSFSTTSVVVLNNYVNSGGGDVTPYVFAIGY
jgi:hypothetical protein